MCHLLAHEGYVEHHDCDANYDAAAAAAAAGSAAARYDNVSAVEFRPWAGMRLCSWTLRFG